jgi:CRP-like cAMP-binding protein
MRIADEVHICWTNSKLFAGLDDTALKKVLEAAHVRHFAPKINITRKGHRPDHLFLMRRGRARSYILTESGSEIVLLWAVPGTVLGLVSLLRNPPTYMVNAMTVTECEFLEWDHRTIRILADAYPQLTENSFRLALHYLGRYMKRHASIMTESAESRLAQTLLQLASEAGQVKTSGIAIEITNEQLSSLADISFFTAARILSKWEHDRKLCKERGRVTLLAPEALMAA